MAQTRFVLPELKVLLLLNSLIKNQWFKCLSWVLLHYGPENMTKTVWPRILILKSCNFLFQANLCLSLIKASSFLGWTRNQVDNSPLFHTGGKEWLPLNILSCKKHPSAQGRTNGSYELSLQTYYCFGGESDFEFPFHVCQGESLNIISDLINDTESYFP